MDKYNKDNLYTKNIDKINLISKIYKKYDLSINLIASDRSVMYCILSGKKTISAVEKSVKKSWWKRALLTQFYYFDDTEHILLNNLKPLSLLDIEFEKIHKPIVV